MDNRKELDKFATRLYNAGVVSTTVYQHDKLCQLIFFVGDKCIQLLVKASGCVEVMLNHTSWYINNVKRDLHINSKFLEIKKERIRL